MTAQEKGRKSEHFGKAGTGGLNQVAMKSAGDCLVDTSEWVSAIGSPVSGHCN